MGLLGNVFAKPFCRLTSTLAIYVLLFGLVASIDSANNRSVFLFICFIYAFILIIFSFLIANDNKGTFESYKHGIRGTCAIFGMLMIIGVGVFVENAPNAPTVGNSIYYSPAEKKQAWNAVALGSLMLLFVV